MSTGLAAATPEDFTFVYPQGATEWVASGDWDGNGLLDAVIVDRATGTYRLGFQTPGGIHTWTAPRSSGVSGVSGFTVGLVLDNALDGLAFTSEEANRINLIPANSQSQAGIPVPVYIPSVGPNQVVALDIGGGGNTLWHDLFVGSAWNGVSPFRVTLVRNSDGASFSTLQDAGAIGALERGNRVRIKNGVAAMLAVMERGPTDTLRVVDLTSGLVNPVLALNGLPDESEYVTADFNGDDLGEFLIFQPGASNLMSYPIEEPMAGTY
ncbi:MAG TPA: hypothetical protein VLD18_13070, partial [Verrucomicrobiae bacterium]|nr:hypothetical protein [Verrucomicrobiae bacterium]